MNIACEHPKIKGYLVSGGIRDLQERENCHALVTSILEWLSHNSHLAALYSNAMYLHIYSLSGGGVRVECISDTQGWMESFDLEDFSFPAALSKIVLSDLRILQLEEEWLD